MTKRPMKLIVYDCVSPDALTAKYGPSGNHIINWIQPHLPEAELTRLDIPAGDALPQPGDYDGLIISGSEKGVYDDTPWMLPLRANIEAMRAAGTPIFGICFGHQLMADVFGGKAEKADKGFAAGARSFETADGELPAHVAHQDQVTKVPPGADVIASAPYCPAAALSYDFPALSVQFHPEYFEGFALDLIDMFGEYLMSDEEIAAARASVNGEVSTDLYGSETAAFFRKHIG
ncbi:MAG: type 1 glutamine amidotransferase [Pseudomonadota bacterium]